MPMYLVSDFRPRLKVVQCSDEVLKNESGSGVAL